MRTATIGGAPRTADAPTSQPGRAYRALRVLARAAVRTFYSTVEATGLENVDTHKPTIDAPTHPNSIIDPLLVGLFEDRPIKHRDRMAFLKAERDELAEELTEPRRDYLASVQQRNP